MTSGLPTSRENEAFLVDGKALRLRQTLELKDRSGAIVATIRKRLLAVRDSMDIERGGTVIATVKKAVFSPLHHRSVVELPGGGELEAVGNITVRCSRRFQGLRLTVRCWHSLPRSGQEAIRIAINSAGIPASGDRRAQADAVLALPLS